VQTLKSNMQVELKVAERRDGDVFFNLYRHSLQRYFADTMGWDDAFRQAAFRFSFPIDRCKRITVEDATNEARFGGVVCTSRNSDGSQEINLLLIEPSLQCNGIGELVLDHLCQNAALQHRSTRLSTFKLNVRAAQLYRRLGFNVIAEDQYYFHFEREPLESPSSRTLSVDLYPLATTSFRAEPRQFNHRPEVPTMPTRVHR